MVKTKSKWFSLLRLTFSNSVADLADAIERYGIYFKDEYGRAIKAPKKDKSGGYKSIEYALKRLSDLYQKQSNPGPPDPYEGEFDREDEDPLNFLGWDEVNLPPDLTTKIDTSVTFEKPTPKQNSNLSNQFTPRSPSGLAELFKCYDESQWKRLSKNCKQHKWLLDALAVKGSGRRASTYYPDVVANGLLSNGLLPKNTFNKILFKEAPEHLKDYYRDN